VFNPAESFDGDTDRDRTEYMRADIEALLRCCRVRVLPGWESSKGALLEIAIANAIGLPVANALGVSAALIPPVSVEALFDDELDYVPPSPFIAPETPESKASSAKIDELTRQYATLLHVNPSLAKTMQAELVGTIIGQLAAQIVTGHPAQEAVKTVRDEFAAKYPNDYVPPFAEMSSSPAAQPSIPTAAEKPATSDTATPYEVVTGARQSDYDHPYDNLGQTAALWNAQFTRKLRDGAAFTAEDVCLAMILLKTSRESFKHKDDNITDVHGYAHCLTMIRDKRTELAEAKGPERGEFRWVGDDDDKGAA
jgi:hypothetical protein